MKIEIDLLGKERLLFKNKTYKKRYREQQAMQNDAGHAEYMFGNTRVRTDP